MLLLLCNFEQSGISDQLQLKPKFTKILRFWIDSQNWETQNVGLLSFFNTTCIGSLLFQGHHVVFQAQISNFLLEDKKQMSKSVKSQQGH